MPGLVRVSRESLKCPPIYLASVHADLLLPHFRETAAYRGWTLFAVAIMANHVHIVVGVPGDPDPSDILGDFKSYGSRPLNRRWGKPASGTWWTEGGSKRKKTDQAARLEAVRYVRDQENPLVVWLNAEALMVHFGECGVQLLASGGRQPPDRTPTNADGTSLDATNNAIRGLTPPARQEGHS
jgi:REP element-mobilizing transposase RayT